MTVENGSATANNSRTETATVSGTNLIGSTGTFPVSGGTAVALPMGSVALGGAIMVNNLESNPLAVLNLSNASGGGFAAGIFGKVSPGKAATFETVTALPVYGKSADAALTVQAQVTASEA